VQVKMLVLDATGTFCGEPLRVLDGFVSRLRGLLGSDRSSMPVLITNCSSIHTIGMRFALDVAFIGGDGRVLRVCRGVAPGRLRSCRKAACVVERPASVRAWLVEGNHLRFVRTERAEGGS
jgi:hypothetical protein